MSKSMPSVGGDEGAGGCSLCPFKTTGACSASTDDISRRSRPRKAPDRRGEIQLDDPCARPAGRGRRGRTTVSGASSARCGRRGCAAGAFAAPYPPFVREIHAPAAGHPRDPRRGPLRWIRCRLPTPRRRCVGPCQRTPCCLQRWTAGRGASVRPAARLAPRAVEKGTAVNIAGCRVRISVRLRHS